MIFQKIVGLGGMCFHSFPKLTLQRWSSVRQFSITSTDWSSRAEFRAMTANVFRQEKEYKGIIQDIFSASKEIKVLRLYIAECEFSFKAGQWVDFYVPGIPELTGYSMTSGPHEAKEKGILDLAVKYGKFPPTHWLHTKCLGGEEVTIRVGGDFYYDPQPGTPAATADLLLIGGGVGINPLVSILHQYCHILETKDNSKLSPGKLHLMYSAKTEDELIFKDTFMEMEEKHPSLTFSYFITRRSAAHSDPKFKYSRIQTQDILDAFKNLRVENLLCYVCGPSTMTDDVAALLLKLEIPKECIKFEKWW